MTNLAESPRASYATERRNTTTKYGTANQRSSDTVWHRALFDWEVDKDVDAPDEHLGLENEFSGPLEEVDEEEDTWEEKHDDAARA